jgi:hypothetical protein
LREAYWAAHETREDAPPLWEVLADAFDLSDPDLWRSNSFAVLRPRLTIELEYYISRTLMFENLSATDDEDQLQDRLQRAQALYCAC